MLRDVGLHEEAGLFRIDSTSEKSGCCFEDLVFRGREVLQLLERVCDQGGDLPLMKRREMEW